MGWYSYIFLCHRVHSQCRYLIHCEKSKVLWNNPSVHFEYVLSSLVNKEANWPIGRQDKVMWIKNRGC